MTMHELACRTSVRTLKSQFSFFRYVFTSFESCYMPINVRGSLRAAPSVPLSWRFTLQCIKVQDEFPSRAVSSFAKILSESSMDMPTWLCHVCLG